MFTSIDKALVAILSGLGFLANALWGWNPEWLSPEFYNAVAAGLTGFLVWWVPNKD